MATPKKDSPTHQTTAEVNCDELLELAGPHLYRRNLFRVLGLNVTASAADVRKQQKRLAMQRKLGLAASDGNDVALGLNPPPGDEDIQDAMDRLTDSQLRLLDEVFWFWPTNGDAGADQALMALEKGDVKQASDIWTGLVKKDGHGEMATHNLAVFAHLVALDCETKLISGSDVDPKQKDRLAELWSRALSRWKQVATSEEFWSRVKERVREMNDQKLTTGFVRRIRATLPKALLLINAKIAFGAAERRDAKLAQRHVSLMHEAKYASGLVDDAIREALKPVRNHLKAAVDAAKARWSTDARHGNRHVRDLYAQAANLLAAVDIVLPADNPIRQGMHDMVADAMLEGQIAYVRKTENWTESIELLKLAQQLAAGEALRTRLPEQMEVLRKQAEMGNDWCSPEYWGLPEEILNLLESIRLKADAGDYDGAIRALVVMDPRIGQPLRRCIAYCLNLKGVRVGNEALSEYNAETGMVKKIMDKLRSASDSQRMMMLMRYPSPDMGSFMVPPCLCCGSTYYTSWINFTYKEIPLFMCSSCASSHNAEIESQKQTLRGHISTALEYVLLADEVDPGDTGVQGNIKTLKKTASDISGRVPTTKALKKKLQGEKQRGRHEMLATEAGGTCYFCGKNAADPSCGITVPVCSGEEPVEMIFGKGTEYRYGDVVVPRCRKCRDEHRSLPERIEQWHQARLAAADEKHFPQLAAVIESAKSAVRKAEENQAKAEDRKNFPALAAAEDAAERATRETRDRVDAYRRMVAEARSEFDGAKNIGNECDQCQSRESWHGYLCRKCDKQLFQFSVLLKCCIAAPILFALVVLFMGCGGYSVSALVVSGGLAGVMKILQWLRRRQLGEQRAELTLQRRNAAAAQASQKLEKAHRDLAAVEKDAQPIVKVYDDARKKLRLAQDEAAAKAERAVAEQIAGLQDARNRLKAAQDAAMAQFEKENPEPSRAAGVKPEDTYVQYSRIQELRRKGWGFGREPQSDDNTATGEHSGVGGLIARPPQPVQQTKAGPTTKGRNRILEIAKAVPGDDMIACPICRVQCKARNLVRHYDNLHPGVNLPDTPIQTTKPASDKKGSQSKSAGKTPSPPAGSMPQVDGYKCPQCGSFDNTSGERTANGVVVVCKGCGKKFINTAVSKSSAKGKTSGSCPKCRFGYKWDGSSCGHCGYSGGKR